MAFGRCGPEQVATPLEGNIRFIDIHVHCMTWLTEPSTLAGAIAEARERGLEGIATIALPAVDQPLESIGRMVPTPFRDLLTEDTYRESEATRIRAVIGEALYDDVIVNFMDSRFLIGAVKERYETSAQARVRGLKSLYIVEENTIGIHPMNEVLGISQDEMREAHRQLFELAREKDLPMIYHVDLSYHLEWARELLDAFPTVRTNIPHFGYSRRIMDGLFREFPNLYTDTAALLPFMQQSPGGYREYVEKFPDRVMLGSDGGLWRLGLAFDYAQFFNELGLSPRAREGVLYENASRFIG